MNGDFRAIVWNSLITYFNTGLGEHVEFTCLCVAIEGQDVRAASKTAEICGYEARFLPYEHQEDKKHFIMSKAKEDGTFESLSQELAEKIAKTINGIATTASNAPSQYE